MIPIRWVLSSALAVLLGSPWLGCTPMRLQLPNELSFHIEPAVPGTSLQFWDSKTLYLACERQVDVRGTVMVKPDRLVGADSLVVLAPGYAPQVVWLEGVDEGTSVTLPSEPSITGSLWLDGQPSPGTLTLRNTANADPRSAALDEGKWLSTLNPMSVDVDAEGRFTLRGLPAGRSVSFQMEGTEFVGAQIKATAPARGVEVRLRRGREGFVTGRVVERQRVKIPGEPKRRVRIRCLLERKDGSGKLQVPETVVVGDRFAISIEAYRNEMRSLQLEVLPPQGDRHGFLIPPRKLDPAQSSIEVGDVVIDAADRAIEVVVTGGGKPLPNIDVITDGTNTFRTDARGWATVRVSPATRSITFAGYGVVATCKGLPSAVASPWRVVLERAKPLRVRVLPPREAAMPRAIVHVTARVNGWRPWTGAYESMYARATVPTRKGTVSDGTSLTWCLVPEHGLVELTDVHGAETRIKLVLPGAGDVAGVSVDPDEEGLGEVVLQCPEPTGELVWNVVDEKGQPIEGAVLTSSTTPSWRAHSDARGRVVLQVFGNDVSRVRVFAAGYHPTDYKEGLTLGKGGPVVLRRR